MEEHSASAVQGVSQPQAVAPQPDAIASLPQLKASLDKLHADYASHRQEQLSQRRKAHSRRRGGIRMRHAPALDGLRGLAVLAVIIYHFWKPALPGGYLGVDMFFVLSGFLISSQLIREFSVRQSVSLREFWRRRLRRILPAAVTILVVITAVAGLLGGDAAVRLKSQFFGCLFFLSNWVQIADSQSYFAGSSVQIFAHYWSLAVEEQFYFVWPLLFSAALLAGAWIWQGVPLVFTASLSLLSVGMMAAAFVPGEDPTRVYYGTDTHAFGLLLGAIIALLFTSNSVKPTADSWPDRTSSTFVGISGFLALAGLLGCFFFLDDALPFTYRGGIFLANLLVALLLSVVIVECSPLVRLFSVAPLRWLGLRSFSLYLWHWPVYILLSQVFGQDTTHTPGQALGSVFRTWRLTDWQLALASVVITVAASELTYRVIENPFRRRGYRATLGSILQPVLLVLGTLHRQAVRAALVCLLGLLAVVMAMLALITSPSQTPIEVEFETLQKAQAQAQAEAAKAEQAKRERIENRVLPRGDQITALGDSVLLASFEALSTRYPGIYIDGAVSRHWNMLPPMIADLENQNLLDQFVVLGFGTNGHTVDYGPSLDDIVAQLGPDRVIVMVSPYGAREVMPQAREEINQAARKYPNVFVADWCHAISGHRDLLADGDVHPNADGAELYVDAIADAFSQWKNENKKIPDTCTDT